MPTTVTRFVSAVMPRPGQRGAISFDGSNAIRFLKDWVYECEQYRWDVKRQCEGIADYCTPEIKKNIRMMQGFRNSDWTDIKREFKTLYSKYEIPEYSGSALASLIKDGPGMDLDVYLF